MPSTPRDRNPRAGGSEPGDDGIRRLFEAASARPDELPGIPPFFAARVKAAARGRAARPPIEFVASAAWHALPALVALVAALSLWAGLEIGRDAAAQEEVAMVVLQGRAAGPDAPLSTLLLPGQTQVPPTGGRR